MKCLPPTVRNIVHRSAEEHGVTVSEVLSGWKTPKCVQARAGIVRQLRACRFTYNQIGNYLDLHHSSVIWLAKKHPAKQVNLDELTTPDESGVWAI